MLDGSIPEVAVEPSATAEQRAIRLLALPTAILLVASLIAAIVVDEPITGEPGVRLTSGTSAFAAAAAATQAAGSSRVSLRQTISGGSQKIEIKGEGALRFKDSEGWLKLDMPGGGDDEIEARFVEGVSYVRYPRKMAEPLHVDTAWIAIPNPPSSTNTGTVPAAGASPSEAITALADGSNGLYRDIREVGREEVRGVPTVHYAGGIDPAALAAKLQALAKESGAPEVASSEIGDLRIEFWIDFDGPVRRYRQTTETGSAPSYTVRIEMEYYDFGTEVTVAAPSEEDVTRVSSYSELMHRATATATASAG